LLFIGSDWVWLPRLHIYSHTLPPGNVMVNRHHNNRPPDVSRNSGVYEFGIVLLTWRLCPLYVVVFWCDNGSVLITYLIKHFLFYFIKTVYITTVKCNKVTYICFHVDGVQTCIRRSYINIWQSNCYDHFIFQPGHLLFLYCHK